MEGGETGVQVGAQVIDTPAEIIDAFVEGRESSVVEEQRDDHAGDDDDASGN
jgi:hypothetical protein